MLMTEWTEQQLRTRLTLLAESQFVYLYTPWCGTCKMTEKMLQVILTLRPDLPIVKSNVNFCPQLVQSWKIESVPCIVHLKQHSIEDKRYRMQGVDDLLQWFHKALNGNEPILDKQGSEKAYGPHFISQNPVNANEKSIASQNLKEDNRDE